MIMVTKYRLQNILVNLDNIIIATKYSRCFELCIDAFPCFVIAGHRLSWQGLPCLPDIPYILCNGTMLFGVMDSILAPKPAYNSVCPRTLFLSWFSFP